jgi:hypothetical protein
VPKAFRERALTRAGFAENANDHAKTPTMILEATQTGF